MRATLLIAILLIIVPSMAAQDLLTVAEESQFTKTSTNEEVMDYCLRLAAGNQKVRLTILGRTTEGIGIPLLIIGDPAPAHPGDMLRDSRLTVYAQGNIHPGEVDGKEGLLMLARDIAFGKQTGLLDNLVILIVPNYNVEGAAHMSPDERYYQPGPKLVGRRQNSMNLDLNRDWIKLETPESRMIVGQVFNAWDPVLVVDCHTTNGSLHLEPMTWAPQMHPSGESAVKDYTTNDLLPAAAAFMLDEYALESIPYGNFMDREDRSKGWQTFQPQPRYTTNYAGIRNRLSVLLESYVYASYKDRIMAQYAMVLGMFKHVAENREKISGLIRNADYQARVRAESPNPGADVLALEVEVQPYDDPVTIKTWEGREIYTDEEGRRKVKPRGERIDVTVPYYGKFVATRTVPLPVCYAFDSGERAVAEKLLQHGIVVEKLAVDTVVTAQRFHIEELKSAEMMYQGHIFTSLTGEWKEEEMALGAGTYIVSTAQPLGMLAAYLLEPESDDGLTTWNFFDRRLMRQWGRRYLPHPVVKIMKSITLQTIVPGP